MLPAPKPRSKTWLSTCYALDTEDSAAALCGPEYHVRPPVTGIRDPGYKTSPYDRVESVKQLR